MGRLDLKVFIGFDANEIVPCLVADYSLRRTASVQPKIHRLALPNLQYLGLYDRPMYRLPNGMLWDVRSEAPMSTEHAIARFFVPHLCGHQGWALFTDGDVLFRADVAELVAVADPQYAVMVVQHPPLLSTAPKKDGQLQWVYPRKNWSSIMLWNLAHPAHAALTLEVLNTWPGRDLHAFGWLKDEEIGALPQDWNHLVNVTPHSATVKLAHFTLGTPNLPGHEADPYADEWFDVAKTAGYHFERQEASA